jgi:2-hydroxychromene-2-carboxylate isomerase
MAHIDLYFDFSSPYSYLTATQLPALAARYGHTVRWRPIVLMAVFEAANNRMPASSPPKARWMMGDLARWSRHYGVPFRMNSRFPLNTIPTMRLSLVAEAHGKAQELCLDAFHRMWALDQDITSPAALAELAAAAGLPAGADAQVQSPEIKAALKASTDEAIARGVFGAPAMFVGDAMFWGNDRLDFVEQELAARQ